MTTTRYIAYYRVSTEHQGENGLGMAAQRKAVADYLNGHALDLIGEYTEVETGKTADRPQLQAALALARKRKAVLVIAKLDRLARNVAFISGLMEAGVKFVAVDMPQASTFQLHIYAALAEEERRMISSRTRAALAAAVERGVVLGNPNLPAMNQKLQAASVARARALQPLVEELAGLSATAAAAEMNRRKIPSATGTNWSAKTVIRLRTRLNPSLTDAA
jgi:DNA invertase Pin-like site-specific DNA recombinase